MSNYYNLFTTPHIKLYTDISIILNNIFNLFKTRIYCTFNLHTCGVRMENNGISSSGYSYIDFSCFITYNNNDYDEYYRYVILNCYRRH